MSLFYKLKVKSILRQTKDAVQVVFEIPNGLKENFSYQAGQYLTLSLQINGLDVRRSYSICSVHDEDLSVVVKAIENGIFSNYANTALKVGDVINVMPPEGHFIIENQTSTSNYAALAAGSGITPVMALIKTVLKANSTSKFLLMYGNKSKEDTIFYEELIQLQSEYKDRFFVEFAFSQVEQEGTYFGRIDKPFVNFNFKNKYKDLAFSEYFLCGPEELIHQSKAILISNGIDEEKIKYELFYSTEAAKDVDTPDGMTRLTVIVDDDTHHIVMDSKTLVLDGILNQDIDVPYSCQGGVCSSCIAKVTKGKAVMQKNQILTEGEIEEGLILTCQALAQTKELEVDYDNV